MFGWRRFRAKRLAALSGAVPYQPVWYFGYFGYSRSSGYLLASAGQCGFGPFVTAARIPRHRRMVGPHARCLELVVRRQAVDLSQPLAHSITWALTLMVSAWCVHAYAELEGRSVAN